MEDRIQVDLKDGVADVRLVRADKMNALDDHMFQALIDTGEMVALPEGDWPVELEAGGSLDLRKPVSTTPTLPPPTPTLLPPVELATPLPDTPAPTLTLLPGRNTPASLPTFTPWPTNTRTSP